VGLAGECPEGARGLRRRRGAGRCGDGRRSAARQGAGGPPPLGGRGSSCWGCVARRGGLGGAGLAGLASLALGLGFVCGLRAGLSIR